MLRIYNKFNKSSKCPICKSNKEGKAVLIPIYGTQEGNIAEGLQVHLDCLNLTVTEDKDIIYQSIK